MQKEQKFKEFLKTNVNPIFERLIVDMLIENPDNIVKNSRKINK
jgi:hypothetical protein